MQYTFSELCRALGKSPIYVRSLQRMLALPVSPDGEGYSVAYLNFLEGIVSLRVCSVPLEQIVDLFEKERRILELLHIDSLSESPTWYLDHCQCEERTEQHLLLTGLDLGFPIQSSAVQSNLDFRKRTAELFSRDEMGEDVIRLLSDYARLLRRVRHRVEEETPVLRNTLVWSERALRPLAPPATADGGV